jgi:hypothetical protein
VEAAFGRHAAELETAITALTPSERRQLYGLLKKLASSEESVGNSYLNTKAEGRPEQVAMPPPDIGAVALALSEAVFFSEPVCFARPNGGEGSPRR